ncbi:LIC_12708 family protein, partial [Treponema pallidum]|uniref:LIC_12708 family protein n=1 Tax=Treponema pallidum TaxID=160 RepID=UPI0020CA5853
DVSPSDLVVTRHPLRLGFFTFFLLGSFLVLVSSCTRWMGRELHGQRLFALTYGDAENQLHFPDAGYAQSQSNIQLCMKDGIFYVAHAATGKVMRMTSFGDVLAVIFNPEKNAMTPQFSEGLQSAAITTRRAVPYPLHTPTFLAVDSQNTLYVVDAVLPEHVQHDPEENLALVNTILLFDEEGRFMHAIGQQGIGGTPFPAIEGVYVNSADELVVVCRSVDAMRVYWFNAQRVPIHQRALPFSPLPTSFAAQEKGYAFVERVLPDVSERRLIAKVDYYTAVHDPATGANSSVRYAKSSVYFISLETGVYEWKVDLPAHEVSGTENQERGPYKKAFSLLGVSAQQGILCVSPDRFGYAALLLDLRSFTIRQRSIHMRSDTLVYNVFHFSPTGILSSVLATDTEAVVMWWRFDRILSRIK